MGDSPMLHPINWIRHKLVDIAVRLLTKPLSEYTVKVPNDLLNLRRYIRKGDVVLVEGNERISEVIKYLTQSSWSHSALYVGDAPLKRLPHLKKELLEKYGEEANYLVVEALVETGVVLSPLSKYREFNIRVCRPYNLAREDLGQLMELALSEVGYSYDVKNIVDLARYFLPVSLVPRRFRRKALQLGSGEPTRVICSSLIADCFHRIKFPIVPKYRELPATDEAADDGFKGRLRRLVKGPDARRYGVFERVEPALVTPRDFDLSPYFEVIKFNIIEDLKFDYRKIMWADDEPLAPELEKSARSG